MSRLIAEPSEHLLIVEGPDDLHVLRHLRERQNSLPTFCIEDKGSDSELLNSIVLEARVEDRKALGILIDANDNLSARWDALSYRLSSEGIQTPAIPDPNGTIINTLEKPRIGIWLMPDNRVPSELEDFIAQMIPQSDAVWPLSRRYVDGIPRAERKFTEGKQLKAKIHAWLAVRAEPRRMGLAIRARDLKVEGELCQRFVAWLTRLFI